jgi:hypothetical protein
MTTPSPPLTPQQAQSKPASGATPSSHNNMGKIITQSSPEPEKKAARPDLSDFEEYVDSIDEDEIQEEGERLKEELEDAIAAGDKRRAYQIRDAMAGLRQKGLDAGMNASELASVHGDMGQRLIAAFAQWGGRGKRMGSPRLGVKRPPASNSNSNAAQSKGGTAFEKKPKTSNPDPCKHKNDVKKKRYIVYEGDSYDKKTGQYLGNYVGRSSGTENESPQTIVTRRFKNHHRNLRNPRILFVTESYAAARGAEQMYIEANSTVKQINGVSSTNNSRDDYKKCAQSKIKK